MDGEKSQPWYTAQSVPILWALWLCHHGSALPSLCLPSFYTTIDLLLIPFSISFQGFVGCEQWQKGKVLLRP